LPLRFSLLMVSSPVFHLDRSADTAAWRRKLDVELAERFFHRGPRGIRGFFSCVWSVSWVQFPNAWIGRPSRRVGRCWPEIFESMNLGLPNQIAAPNRRLPLGPVPWSFAALKSQGSAVGELVRPLHTP